MLCIKQVALAEIIIDTEYLQKQDNNTGAQASRQFLFRYA